MKNKIFLDISFLIAIAVARDEFHERALDLTDEIEAAGAEIVTTKQ